MEEKTIEVPTGTDRVTLKLGRRETPPAEVTLRQMLMTVPSDRCVVVRVLDRFPWELRIPVLFDACDEMSKRKARIDRCTECKMCNVSVLLDERKVKNMTTLDQPGKSTVFVFEVDADGV